MRGYCYTNSKFFSSTQPFVVLVFFIFGPTIEKKLGKENWKENFVCEEEKVLVLV